MSVEAGKLGEDAAAIYLTKVGFEILQRNWRTRWCEIDIVATKSGAVYFVECKYRARPNWGSGLEYITNSKLRQMHFAADFWVASNNWQGDYYLSAIELAGSRPQVTEFIQDLS